jgi:hypothetical protein
MTLVRKLMVSLLPVLLVATACGGDDPVDAQGPEDAGPRGPSGPAAEAQALAVDGTFWHSGFQVEVVGATLSAVEENLLGQPRRQLTVAARFTNQGPDQRTFPAEVSVVAGGRSYPAATADLPPVPSGLATEGGFTFPVEVDIDLSSAYLLVGRAGEGQARVPIGPAGGELVALAPREVPLSGELSLELIDLTWTGADLRADVPATYSQVESGRLSLWLYFDVTSRRSGNWTIRLEDFAIILPSGSSVAAVGSEPTTLPGDDDGLETAGLYVRFLVDDPPEGEYTLRFTAPTWFRTSGSDAPTEATFSFTI